MKQIKTIEIDNEKVYLKKDWFGWRVVEPIKDPETNRFIWQNFFSKKGFLTLGFLLLILLFGYLGFKEQLSNYKQVMENPCDYCEDCFEENINPSNSFNDVTINDIKLKPYLGGEVE